jgi:H+/Cl- antiporter ClcA
MSYVRKSLANVLGSIAGVIVVAAIAVWQFYQFVTFRDARGILDAQGGTSHLWWAIAMALFACIASFFVFSVFLRHDRDDELHISS